MSELKPCPFCGGAVREYSRLVRPPDDALNCEVQYVCFTCGVHFKIPFAGLSHEEFLAGVVNAWNRRVND